MPSRCHNCGSKSLVDTLEGRECQNCFAEIPPEIRSTNVVSSSPAAPTKVQLECPKTQGSLESALVESSPKRHKQKPTKPRSGNFSTTRAAQDKRIQAGLCQRCGSLRDGPYKAYCNKCALKQRESSRKRAKSKKWSGDGRPPMVEDLKPPTLGNWSIPVD